MNPWLTELKGLAEPSYAAFNARLVPTVDSQRILGVRMPQLRSIVRRIITADDAKLEAFLTTTPHDYLEENLLHVLLLNEIKDLELFVASLEAFFPFIDNWMVSDALSPRLARDVIPQLEPHIHRWVQSADLYPARCGVVLLMKFFLGQYFDKRHLRWVATIKSDDYYAHMAAAWYFATALATQPEHVRAVFFAPETLDLHLSLPVRRKAVQKALESRRIPDQLKIELRQLRTTLVETE